ncbi:hypothetical protein F4801DRAFT_557551 [Xylaria longipes]|nr:hypothetical protein F4801DRAFT_557551 [Xylaria longipes]
MASGSGPPQPGTQPAVQQAAAAHVDNRPLSPWAERYGPYKNSDPWPTEPVKHSNFAPIHPPVHPVFYGDEPSVEGHEVFSSGYEKDRLFVSEVAFKAIFHSIQPWQLGPMTRSLRLSQRGFIPGGHISSLSGEAHIHRLIYDTERIQVDEDSWFPFLKKNRWRSTAANEPSILSGNLWSVDDPKVWEELRISLELANRILNALVKDKHIFLQTLLFGKLTYWETARQELFPDQLPPPNNNSTVLLSYPFYKNRFAQVHPNQPCDMDPVLALTEDQYRDQLCRLGSQQDWALVDVKHESGDREGGRTYTLAGSMIFLNVGAIRPLIKDNITLAERLELVYHIANTVLHELSHALLASRVRDDNSHLNQLGRYEYREDEPFIDFNAQAEMGYAFETALYGGAIRSAVHRGPGDTILAPHKVTWPFPTLLADSSLGSVVPGHPATGAGVENRLTLIPSLWYSAMLSEDFWQNDSIPRKSDSFRIGDYFCSRTPHKPGVDEWEYKRAPVIEGNPEQLDAGYADMVTNWKLRESLWNQSRAGWYDVEKGIWENSPWSDVPSRMRMNAFSQEMNKPLDQRDLILCVHETILLIGSATWIGGQQDYIASVLKNQTSWIYHAIGLLMLACLPLRTDNMTRQQPLPNVIIHALIPCSTGYPRKITRFCQPQRKDWVPESAITSPYVDHLGGNGQISFYAKGSFNHLSYLDLVSKLLKFFANNNIVVSTPWLDEILRVEDKIRTYRMNQALAGGDVDPDQTWAAEAWDFNVPEYDPHAVSQWSDIIAGWGPV